MTGKVSVMSNKLRSFLIVVMSIVVVMAALPMNAFRVNADVVYFLTYDGNEGKDETGSSVYVQTSNDQGQFTISDNILPKIQDAPGFIREGYVFKGWADSEGTTYTVGGEYTPGGDLKIYAQWAKACVITFDPNYPVGATGSSINMDKQQIEIGTSANLNENLFTCSGYRFDGWKDADENAYADRANFTANSDNVTLRAQWKPIYLITYNPNNKTTDFYEDSLDKDSATPHYVRSDAFWGITFPGYDFLCWNTEQDGTGTEYNIGYELTPTADVTLYAQWARTITFNDNLGSSTPTTQKITVGSPTNLTPNGFSYTDDTKSFVGWTTVANPTDKTIEYTDGSSVTLTGDDATDITNLYAQWGIPCTVHFKANYPEGATGTSGSMNDLVVGKGFKTPINNGYLFTGHTFKGWNTQPDGTGVQYDANSISLDDSYAEDEITLYAQWEDIPYTIKFMSEDGSTEIGTVTCTYGNTPSFTGTNPTKEKTDNNVFVFDGWSKETYSTGSVLSTLPEVKADAIYYAHFKSYLRYYSVTASVSDSEGGSVSGSGNYEWESNAIVKVTLNTGYRVKKWTVDGTDVASTATTYTIENVKDSHDVQVVLEKVPHTITVSATEGGQATVQDNLVYGDTANAVAVANTGYSFVNWTENGTEVSTDSTYAFTVTSDRTLTANFIINSYDISLTSDGNGTVEGSGTYNHFSTANVIAAPNTGYHFVNWTDENGTEVNTSATFSFEVDGARNLTANFAINSYSVATADAEHGSVSGGGTYNYSDTCTLVAMPDKGYHFVGWEEDGTIVSENANYRFQVSGNRNLKAIFEINMYTVTYKNDDGTVLQESEFAWGSTAYYQHMANPTKKPTEQFTYTFAGWDNKETLVTKDITYTATYTSTVNKYKITFINEDGTVLQTSEIEYGKFPVYEKDTPTKAATVEETFTFAGWDKEIAKVTGETVYKATYTSKPITKDSINYKYFTVAFVSNGGSEVVSQLVAEGGVAFRPEEPLRERYTFGGWYIDAALTKPFSFATVITSDITLYAKWIKGSPDIEATYAVVGLGTTTFELGSGEDITVDVERSQDNDSIAKHFKGVLIDGVDVDYYNYEFTEDNGLIIRAEALEGLEAGTHTITIVYDDGTAEVELIIADANEPTLAVEKITETEAGNAEPDKGTTEKTVNWGLWIALGIVAIVVIAAIPIFIIKGRSLK